MRRVVMIADSVAARVAASSGKNGRSAALRRAGMLVCLLLMFSAMGCAPKIYNVNMRYQPTKAIKSAVTDGRKFSLTVSSIFRRSMKEATVRLNFRPSVTADLIAFVG